MKISQGDIMWADLSPVKGHEQAGFRPVLVLQNNILNPKLNTVVVAPITSNLQAKGKLLTFFLSASDTRLPQDSVALLFQVRTLDKSRLKKKVSTLETDSFQEVKKQLWYLF